MHIQKVPIYNYKPSKKYFFQVTNPFKLSYATAL